MTQNQHDRHTLRSQRNNTSILTQKEKNEVAKRSRKRALLAVEEREHLRLEIEARDILQRMGATVNTFVRGYEDVTAASGDIIQQPLSRERIQALKAAADIDKVLLDRVLPALKPVEPAKQEQELPDPGTLSDNALRITVAKYLGLDSIIPLGTPDETLQ